MTDKEMWEFADIVVRVWRREMGKVLVWVAAWAALAGLVFVVMS